MFFPLLTHSQFYQQQIIYILSIILMEHEPGQSTTLSDFFKNNLIFKAESSLSNYQVHPSIIKNKYKLQKSTELIESPMFTELLEKIKRVKEVLDELQMSLNNDDRTIYEPMQACNPAEIENQAILSKFISILETFQQDIVPKMNTLPIYLTNSHNFQQQITHQSKIIYEEQKQKAILWDYQVKGKQKQTIITAESSIEITGGYHKIVKINRDKEQIKFGQLFNKKFQGILAQKKGEQFLISIGRWKWKEHQPIEIIIVNFISNQRPFLIHRKFMQRKILKSTIWFRQQGQIKYYEENL